MRRSGLITSAALLIAALGVLLVALWGGLLRSDLFNNFAAAPEGWIALATIALAAATFWLGWQTRTLTINAREELDLLRRQTDATIEEVRLIGSDIEASKNLNAYKLLRAEDQRFIGKPFVKKRAGLARALLLSPRDHQEVGDHADFVLEYFEDLGILLQREIVPEYFVWATSAYYVLRYWQATKGYVNWVRAKDDDVTLFEDFEHLYTRMRNYEEKRRGKFSISESEIQRFLIEELEEKDPVALRVCRSADLPRIFEIEESAFEEPYAYERPQLQELFRNHTDGFLVAELLGEKVVGYVVGYNAGEIIDIDSIAVDPFFHRIGCGKKLVLALIKRLMAPGVAAVSLETSVSNQGGQEFFRSLGFEVAERVEDFYGDGRAAYRMRKPLVDPSLPAETRRANSAGTPVLIDP